MANLTPSACRAARALLGIGVRELADLSGLGFAGVSAFENGRRSMREVNRAKLAAVLEERGVEILNGDSPGARLRAKLASDDADA